MGVMQQARAKAVLLPFPASKQNSPLYVSWPVVFRSSSAKWPGMAPAPALGPAGKHEHAEGAVLA